MIKLTEIVEIKKVRDPKFFMIQQEFIKNEKNNLALNHEYEEIARENIKFLESTENMKQIFDYYGRHWDNEDWANIGIDILLRVIDKLKV